MNNSLFKVVLKMDYSMVKVKCSIIIVKYLKESLNKVKKF